MELKLALRSAQRSKDTERTSYDAKVAVCLLDELRRVEKAWEVVPDRVYIAGPMSGYPDLNFPAFHETAAALRKVGFDVINPAEINGGDDEAGEVAKMTPEEYAVHWQNCMRKDVSVLMTCTGVYMLPGWEKSKGATIEHNLAVALGLCVTYQPENSAVRDV